MSKRKKNKKRRRSRRQGPSLDRRVQSQLWEVADLVHREKWAEARAVLEPLNSRHPRQVDILSALAEVLHHLGDYARYEAVCAELSSLNPNDPAFTLSLGGAYLLNGRPALALRTLQRFVDRWGNDPKAGEVRTTIAEVGARLDGMLAEQGLAGVADSRLLAEQHEEVQALLNEGQFTRSRRIAEQLLQRWPDFKPALNNLSLASFGEGNFDQAIAAAQRVLALDADNYHALANLVRFCVVAGRHAEALAAAERLKALHSSAPGLWLKKAEALSYLGDDAGVLEALRSRQHAGESDARSQALLYHLAAVAASRLGKEKEARGYWQRALQVMPGCEPARDNLDDLAQPVGKRHAPWPFAMTNWLPQEPVGELVRRLKPVARARDDQAVTNEVRRYLQNHPELTALVPILFDRGDPAAREFAFRLCRMAETPELHQALADFALSRRGPDELRLEALQAAVRAGLLSSGAHRVFLDGQWRETLAFGFELHGEAITPHSPAVEPLARQAIEAIHKGDGPRGERLLRKALELEPDSIPLRNNLASAYLAQGRGQEAEAEIRAIHAEHPDYLFGRVNMSQFYVREGRLDKAQEMLDPLLSRRRLHFTEFASLCMGQINLLLARGERQAAQSWLGLWEQADPDHPALAEWRRRVRRPSWLHKLAGMR
jgi:tetratricopeptide (TPR) repeat protein